MHNFQVEDLHSYHVRTGDAWVRVHNACDAEEFDVYEVHGVAGSSPVVATSFTALVQRLLAGDGDHWYWLERGWASLGDAYDGVAD